MGTYVFMTIELVAKSVLDLHILSDNLFRIANTCIYKGVYYIDSYVLHIKTCVNLTQTLRKTKFCVK